MNLLNIEKIRSDFPILNREVNSKKLIYLDNAATTQKPKHVLEASSNYYRKSNANIHRAAHTLARDATESYERARQKIAAHLSCSSEDEIIFTSGTTDSINLVSNILSDSGKITPDDTIIISGLEHHSNIVPWQMLCQKTGATLKIIEVLEDGSLDLESYKKLLTEKVKLVAVNHISNALGTINPVKEITSLAHDVGAWVLIDGAQALPHLTINVKDLDCDFYAFSGHKVYAPTGIGALFGKKEILSELPPWRGGGEMIKHVSFQKTTYNDLPFKYEAGTPNIEGAIAMASAIDYVNGIGLANISKYERILLEKATNLLSEIPGLRIFGTTSNKSAIVSFSINGVHHYDLGTLLDQMGIAVRTGHHCCQPLMERFGITGTVRASFAFYNTTDEVKALGLAVNKAIKLLK